MHSCAVVYVSRLASQAQSPLTPQLVSQQPAPSARRLPDAPEPGVTCHQCRNIPSSSGWAYQGTDPALRGRAPRVHEDQPATAPKSAASPSVLRCSDDGVHLVGFEVLRYALLVVAGCAVLCLGIASAGSAPAGDCGRRFSGHTGLFSSAPRPVMRTAGNSCCQMLLQCAGPIIRGPARPDVAPIGAVPRGRRGIFQEPSLPIRRLYGPRRRSCQHEQVQDCYHGFSLFMLQRPRTVS